MKSIRNSSIELLKIIAIVLIIISHSVPYGTYSNYSSFINLNICSNNFQNIILTFMRYFGSIGNCIFIICSCWFLTNKDKINKNKIIKLFLEATIISILIMLFFTFVLKINYAFDSKELLKMVFPLFFSSYWFITCYLLFYFISPLLNIIIKNISRKKHLLYLCVFGLIGLISVVKSDFLYFNNLFGFITIYFLISYLKNYKNDYLNNKKINLFLSIISFILIFVSILFTNMLGLRFSLFSDKLLLLNKFYNPIIILLSLSLFNIFNMKSFHIKTINYISSMSLLIYLFHGQQFIQGFLKGSYFNFITSNSNVNVILASLILSVIFFVGSLILSIIFSKIKLLVTKLFNKEVYCDKK